MAGLTLIQIRDTFADCPAAKTAVNSNIRKLSKIVRENERIKWESGYSQYDNWTKDFIGLVLDYEPGGIHSQEYKQLKRLKILKRMSSKQPENEDGISQAEIDQAKNTPILEIHHFEKTKRSGKRTWVSCPLHGEDRNPSMLINKNNTVKCFTCGFYGDSIDIVQKLNNLGFINAVRWICGKETKNENNI